MPKRVSGWDTGVYGVRSSIGATTISIMTLRIMSSRLITLSITSSSIITLSMMLSSIMILSVKGLNVTISISDTKQNDTQHYNPLPIC
jgi:hypothetical protein